MTATWRDAARLAAMAGGYLVTAVLPARFDPSVTHRAANLFFRLRPQKRERFAEHMANVLGPAAAGRDLVACADDYYRMVVEGSWGRIRGLHRRAWNPEIRLHGLERLQQALAGGRGAVLWRMSFCESPIAKHALWAAGIPLVHLSRAQHGAWSERWFAVHLLCPLHRRAEDCYLTERVLIPMSGALGYMRHLLECLAGNATVSIFGEYTGRQNVRSDLFGVFAEFATGAPALAWKMGSPLLTSYVVQEGPARYRVVVDEPIELDRGLGRKEFAHHAVAEFARRLQHTISEYPASWQGWGRFLAARRLPETA